jgi:hypothetical protein
MVKRWRPRPIHTSPLRRICQTHCIPCDRWDALPLSPAATPHAAKVCQPQSHRSASNSCSGALLRLPVGRDTAHRSNRGCSKAEVANSKQSPLTPPKCPPTQRVAVGRKTKATPPGCRPGAAPSPGGRGGCNISRQRPTCRQTWCRHRPRPVTTDELGRRKKILPVPFDSNQHHG